MSALARELLALALASCLGCTNIMMAVPAEVAGLEVFQTSDRSVWRSLAQKDFGFRAYRVTDVDRSWDSTTKWESGPFSNQQTTGGYAFTFRAEALKLAGKCALSSSANQVKLGKRFRLGSDSSQLGCTCDEHGGSSSVLIARSKLEYQGQMKVLNQRYAVVSLHRLAQGTFWLDDPAGYRIDGEGAVAAVEVLYPGRVWLALELNEAQRVRVSCLLAGLMLYQPPSDPADPG